MDYRKCDVIELSYHLETVSRQSISAQLLLYTSKRDTDIVEKIKEAKQLIKVRKSGERGRYIHGVGIYEKGKHPSSGSGYRRWAGILDRCDPDFPHKSYIGCSVDKSFIRFQDFMEWAVCQVGFDSVNFDLDKDLLFDGNKVYGADTCVFLPREINRAFLGKKPHKDKELPTGVTLHRGTGKFLSRVIMGRKTVHLGLYTNIDEAFAKYKTAKEGYIKSLAEKWKDRIDIRAYDALMRFEATPH